MSESNFIHISKEYPQLASIGKLAERNVYLDPNASLSKLKLFLEKLTVFIIDFEQVNELHGLTQNERLRLTKIQDRYGYDAFYLMEVGTGSALFRKTRLSSELIPSTSRLRVESIMKRSTYRIWNNHLRIINKYYSKVST